MDNPGNYSQSRSLLYNKVMSLARLEGLGGKAAATTTATTWKAMRMEFRRAMTLHRKTTYRINRQANVFRNKQFGGPPTTNPNLTRRNHDVGSKVSHDTKESYQIVETAEPFRMSLAQDQNKTSVVTWMCLSISSTKSVRGLRRRGTRTRD